MSLQKPPKRDEPSRVVARVAVLLVLLLVVGVAIWAAVTNQRIEVIENTPASSVELEDPAFVDERRINVEMGSQGRVAVVLLHDLDVAGSVTLRELAAEIPEGFRPVLVDLPGYGLSDRVPGEGSEHTVASMSEVVAQVIEDRFQAKVVLVGVGLGGKVAAELAATEPDLVRGLVMVDVDFWESDTWAEYAQRLPWVGRAATFTFSAGGPFADDRWAPHCEEGGWCPDQDDLAARGLAASIAGSTDTIYSHLRTLPSSLVPADLDEIVAPVAYVLSRKAGIPDESIQRVEEKLPDLILIEADVWQAHLESPAVVVEAIEAVGA